MLTNDCNDRTLGQFLAERLVQLNIGSYFAVPGDYNLSLLDELNKNKDLNAIYTCNELNAGIHDFTRVKTKFCCVGPSTLFSQAAGYAAEGYARVQGVGAVVSTFTVGSLSLINAIACAYAENEPVICIVGGPNSNDFASNHILHHSIGKKFDFMQEMRCFKEVTCEQVVIQNLEDAVELIDQALSAAITHHKPVYISICCNLANLTHPSFQPTPVKYSISSKISNTASLDAAISTATQFLNSKTKPVLVAGPLLRVSTNARSAFMKLVDVSGYPYAVLPAAKGLVPEDHPQYVGTYWGTVSTPLVNELVESADGFLFAGPVWNDYVTVGYTIHLPNGKMVQVDEYRVSIGGGSVFGCVRMDDFLDGLADNTEFKENTTAMENYRRMAVPTDSVLPPSPPGSPLLTKHLFHRLQTILLTPQSTDGSGTTTTSSIGVLMADTGDSIFNCQKLKLPQGCAYEWSQQYGAIGWSVGAALGAAVAINNVTTSSDSGTKKRVLACIGDGSFIVTAQDVSTMLRYHLNPIIILINNGGYTIEAEIHDGPYNVIQNWDYVGVVKAFAGSGGGDGGDRGGSGVFAVRVTTEDELVDALNVCVSAEGRDKLCFIECVVHKDDCSRELLEWGALVSASNSRPPAN